MKWMDQQAETLPETKYSQAQLTLIHMKRWWSISLQLIMSQNVLLCFSSTVRPCSSTLQRPAMLALVWMRGTFSDSKLYKSKLIVFYMLQQIFNLKAVLFFSPCQMNSSRTVSDHKMTCCSAGNVLLEHNIIFSFGVYLILTTKCSSSRDCNHNTPENIQDSLHTARIRVTYIHQTHFTVCWKLRCIWGKRATYQAGKLCVAALSDWNLQAWWVWSAVMSDGPGCSNVRR